MNIESKVIRLVSSSEPPPAGLESMLRELGAGDVRFCGTTFGRGESDLPTFLEECRDIEAGKNVPAGKVPQATFWVMDGAANAVGMVRIRPHLNENLLQYGGHIGYYIRPAERGKGYAKQALRLALDVLRDLGVTRALVTVHPQNIASARVVLAIGGMPEGQGRDAVTGEIADRYWINL